MEDRYIYKNLNEVPVKWRRYKGARLSLDQVNFIIETAYNNLIITEYASIPDYGKARSLFEESHKIENDLWIAN